MQQQMNERFESWIGRTLNDASGHKVGKIADIYTDDDTGKPEWLAVTTGHFGANVSFVPLTGATPSGDDVQVQFPKDQVKDAPNAGTDGLLSEDEEARLYAHYGLDYDQERVRLQRWVLEEEGSDVDGGGRRVISGPETTVADGEVLRESDASHRAHDRPMGSGSAGDDELVGDQRFAAPREDYVEVGGETRRR